jgi:hypothetical protein
MFELINNGPIGFNMTDTSIAATWRFAMNSDQFRISKDGTGGPEFRVNPDGGLIAGPGGASNLVLQADGDLIVVKDVTAASFLVASSRTRKEAIHAVDPEAVLASVMKLPVSRWQFQDDDSEVRHMGPMAEDFSQAFELGSSNKHISTTDASGVALAAIQGLYLQLERKEHEVARLRLDNETKATQLESLTLRLEALEQAVSRTEKTGPE